MPEADKTDTNSIRIKGARVHNLKNISLDIPREQLVVVTGLSGSGKSSLAFDTLYAEGQRRYVESLSSYARQFLGRIDKPDVDYIHGIPPAVAIEQKVNTRNPRSTVGTSTEIYDYLKLLFARIGKTYSPVSGQEVKRHRVSDVVDHVLSFDKGSKLLLLAPFICCEGTSIKYQLEVYLRQGITRLEFEGRVEKIEDLLAEEKEFHPEDLRNLVIDRFVVSDDEDSVTRYADSVQSAYNIGKGICTLKPVDEPAGTEFSERYELDGIQFEEPSEHMFSFNNPIGACPKCEGYGKVIGIDEDLVVPNNSLSVYEETIMCWRGEKMSKWKDKLVYSAEKFDFPIHRPWSELTEEEKELVWTGNKYFKGLNAFFKMLEENKYKIQYRVMLSRYMGKTTCPLCKGTRLKKEASWVKIQDTSLPELVDLPVYSLSEFFENLQFDAKEEKIAGRLLLEIRSRLNFLLQVGLGYLTLNRLSSTLSGGESQRINLATSLGSSLVGSLYILDEPSIGLHPRDTGLLIDVLKDLQGLGNTLVVVEHDEDIIKSADTIVDIGPGAGRLGGEILFSGSMPDLLNQKKSMTAAYLSGSQKIPVPELRRKWTDFILLKGVRENNLKNIEVRFPLHVMTAITGVSGSGKSSLVKDVLYPALNRKINGAGEKAGKFDELSGDLHRIESVEFVDQNPIGKSSRSNPVTYIKAYDEIRKLYSRQQAAVQNGFKPAHFSFNVEGGRCDECQGEGIIKVEMQFMADVHLICESCKGKRFKDDILEVRYRNKNISDILEMTVDEAIDFFTVSKAGLEKKISSKLKPLQDVGLGYVKLGQSSNTLSGGESQRVKLAWFLSRESSAESVFFIFDEPTTGLHFHDINKLLSAFNALIKKGHSILVVEHNLDVIKSADWIIDLGPEGGEEGGEIVFSGIPGDLVKNKKSYTAKHLLPKLNP